MHLHPRVVRRALEHRRAHLESPRTSKHRADDVFERLRIAPNSGTPHSALIPLAARAGQVRDVTKQLGHLATN